MALATLFNTPVSPSRWAEFSFVNMDEHRKIAAAVLAQLALTIPLYPLDPVPTGLNAAAWLYNHQAIHNRENGILGIAGNDLTAVDFSDVSQVHNWVQLHAEEHRAAAQALGI